MFSGKTTALIQHIERRIIIGDRCAIIGWKDDDRYTTEDEIVCHTGQKYPCMKMNDKELYDSLPSLISAYDTIGIDEGCFFADIYQVCSALKSAGIHVFCSSLIGTHLCEPFGDILRIMPICTDIKFLHAICGLCKNERAAFSYLKDRSLQKVKIGDASLIGGSDKYMAQCDSCFARSTGSN